MEEEPETSFSDLKKLNIKELIELTCTYIDIGIDWNFERAQAKGEEWVNGRTLRDVWKYQLETKFGGSSS